MPKTRLAVIAAALVVTGCAPTDDPAALTASSSTIATAGTEDPDTSGESTLISGDDTAATIAGSDVAPEISTLTPTAGVVVEVDTQPLPTEVASALRDNNGELAPTSTWTARFAVPGFPVLDGADVHLVEGNLDATRITNGWRRIDELQWLFRSSASNRDSVLDDLARQAGIESWARTDSSSIVDAAECVVRDYTNADTSTTWTLQGCDYPMYPGMVAAGASRRAVFDETGAPPAADPSVSGVVDAIDGQIERVTVAFGAPSGGSTSTLVAATQVDTHVADPSDVLAASTLATWPAENAEAGAVVFAGAPGTNWTVLDHEARFTSEGRLNP